MHVDAVEERARDLRLIFLGAFGGAAAGEARIVDMAAAAGVHGGDELEARGIGHMGMNARHHGAPALQRLTQGFQGGARELGQLIEKENAVMGERHLARLGALAAADERGQRGGMMRIAEGPVAHQPAARELARHRMDHRDLEGGGGIERRQQAGQALRQHRFAGPRRADHQQIMPAGRRHLQRPLGGFLPLDIGEIEGMDGKLLHLRARAGRGSGCP